MGFGQLVKAHRLRHRCEIDGCFNLKYRVKFQVFDGVFPRNINFSDIDAFLEIAGAFCVLEWKSPGAPLRLGQSRAFLALTALDSRNVVFVVAGDAATMKVAGYIMIWKRKIHEFRSSDLDGLKSRLGEWARWVESSKHAK